MKFKGFKSYQGYNEICFFKKPWLVVAGIRNLGAWLQFYISSHLLKKRISLYKMTIFCNHKISVNFTCYWSFLRSLWTKWAFAFLHSEHFQITHPVFYISALLPVSSMGDSLGGCFTLSRWICRARWDVVQPALMGKVTIISIDHFFSTSWVVSNQEQSR